MISRFGLCETGQHRVKINGSTLVVYSENDENGSIKPNRDSAHGLKADLVALVSVFGIEAFAPTRATACTSRTACIALDIWFFGVLSRDFFDLIRTHTRFHAHVVRECNKY